MYRREFVVLAGGARCVKPLYAVCAACVVCAVLLALQALLVPSRRAQAGEAEVVVVPDSAR